MNLFKQLFGSCLLGHVGCHHLHNDEQSEHMDEGKALAISGFLACVIPNRLISTTVLGAPWEFKPTALRRVESEERWMANGPKSV